MLIYSKYKSLKLNFIPARFVISFFIFYTITFANAQNESVATIVADFVSLFGKSFYTNTQACEVRPSATSGNVSMPAIFEHPINTATPSRLSWTLDLPQTGSSGKLFLTFATGLADGVDFSSNADGVIFEIDINRSKIFQSECRETRWTVHTIDITKFGGTTVRFDFLVSAGNNTSYDWALWGKPKILLIKNGYTETPKQINSSAGTIVLLQRPSTSVNLIISSANAENQITTNITTLTNLDNNPILQCEDFTFDQVSQVNIRWEPLESVICAYIGAYSGEINFRKLSVDSAAPQLNQPLSIRAIIENNGPGPIKVGSALLQFTIYPRNDSGRFNTPVFNAPMQASPALVKGQTWEATCTWPVQPGPGQYEIEARLTIPAENRSIVKTLKTEILSPQENTIPLELKNSFIKLEFIRMPDGFAMGKIYAKSNDTWQLLGAWKPLFKLSLQTKSGPVEWEPRPLHIKQKQYTVTSSDLNKIETLTGSKVSGSDLLQTNVITFSAFGKDPDNVDWENSLVVKFEPDQPIIRIHYEWLAKEDRDVLNILGPNIYVGEGSTGAAKSWGLFPGLEFLYGPEQSSNPRDFAANLAERTSPDPLKITIPLMAVSVGGSSPAFVPGADRFYCPDSLKNLGSTGAPINDHTNLWTIALSWDPLQKWDQQNAFPSARFSSPNLDEGMSNHRLALFLPSIPKFIPENSTLPNLPYKMSKNKPLTLDASIYITAGPILTAIKQWYADTGGLAQGPGTPRSFQETLNLCREGLLKTVWNENAKKWSHCIGWPPANAPGFATLLFIDSCITKDPTAAQASIERVQTVASNMLAENGPAGFISEANCHILRWEFPFYYGYLPEAISALDSHINALIQSQEKDGGWRFNPSDPKQKTLGQEGDSVLGINSARAAAILKYARITGNTNAFLAGEKTLIFMEKFRIPRGAQTWECPMYEPDILAAARAISAYLDAWKFSGNPRWLHDAVYWAETGIPFIYHWWLPDKPMMWASVIPVFGSTFYSHSWLKMPVQWCGLVYAYHVQQLADILDYTSVSPTDSPLPLSLDMEPQTWRRIAEAITISAQWQQFDSGDKIGTYPDSLTDFSIRNGAFINPENIMVNLLLMHGFNPDIKTAKIGASPAIFISSGAVISNANLDNNCLRFNLTFFKDKTSHTMLSNLSNDPVSIETNDQLIPKLQKYENNTGWVYDNEKKRLFISAMHSSETIKIKINF